MPKNFTSSWERDYRMGMKGERKFERIFKEKFGIDLIHSPDYAFYDYKVPNKHLIIELKTRDSHKNLFRTTIIGWDKLSRFHNFNAGNGGYYKFLIFFQFCDGIYFFEFDPDKKYNIRPYVRKKRKNFDDKEKDYVFFPVNQLRKLDDFEEYLKPPPRLKVVYNC